MTTRTRTTQSKTSPSLFLPLLSPYHHHCAHKILGIYELTGFAFRGDYWLRWAGLTLVPEIIHTVLQIYLIVTSRFHPTFALTGSCILFVCWMTSALINAFLAYSNEISFEHHDEWLRLCWGEVGMQSFMALLYIPMVVFSGVAVHWYRMSRKEDGMKWKVADGEREGSV